MSYLSRQFEEVTTPLDYSLAVARLVSRLHDTHAYASSPLLNDYMGKIFFKDSMDYNDNILCRDTRTTS